MSARGTKIGLCAFLLLSAPVASPAAAKTPVVKLTASGAFDNRYAPGAPVVVTVVIESTRAVEGDLSVTARPESEAKSSTSMRIEVPAGGSKAFDMLVPSSPELYVHFRDEDVLLASQTVSLVPADSILVAVWGTLPGLASIRRVGDAAEVRAVKLRESWLDFGPEALRTLNYVVADADAVRGTPKRSRDALTGWVLTGGRLVLAATSPSALDWLPEGWRFDWAGSAASLAPGSGVSMLAGRALAKDAGLGRVIVIPERFAALGSETKLWEEILTPSARAMSAPRASALAAYQTAGSITSLLGRAVVLVGLIWFLIAYLLLVGPVNYLVLRKIGRKELLWATVPILALVFSGLGYYVARGPKTRTESHQALVVFATADSVSSEKVAALSSPSGGIRTVGFGSGYGVPVGVVNFRSGSLGTTRLTPGGTSVELRSNPLSFAIARGTGEGLSGFLDAQLTWDGRGLFGEVTNRTPYDLSDVRLLVGFESQQVGGLASGGTAPLSFVPRPYGEKPVSNLASLGVSIRGGQGVTIDGLSAGSFEAMTNLLDARLGIERPAGFPLVAGLTTGARPALEVDGRPTSPRTTSLIASPVRIVIPREASGRLSFTAGRSGFFRWEDQGNTTFGSGASGLSPRGLGLREGTLVVHLPKGVRDRVANAYLVIGSEGYSVVTPQVQPTPSPNASPSPANTGSGTTPVARQAVPKLISPRGSAHGTGPVRVEAYDWIAKRWLSFEISTGASEQPIPLTALGADGEMLVRFDASNIIDFVLFALGVEVDLR